MAKIKRDELRDFVVCSFTERYGMAPEKAGWAEMVEVIVDCLDHVHKSVEKPMVSVSYKVGDVETTYSATSVYLLCEARKALEALDKLERDDG